MQSSVVQERTKKDRPARYVLWVEKEDTRRQSSNVGKKIQDFFHDRLSGNSGRSASSTSRQNEIHSGYLYKTSGLSCKSIKTNIEANSFTGSTQICCIVVWASLVCGALLALLA